MRLLVLCFFALFIIIDVQTMHNDEIEKPSRIETTDASNVMKNRSSEISKQPVPWMPKMTKLLHRKKILQRRIKLGKFKNDKVKDKTHRKLKIVENKLRKIGNLWNKHFNKNIIPYDSNPDEKIEKSINQNVRDASDGNSNLNLRTKSVSSIKLHRKNNGMKAKSPKYRKHNSEVIHSRDKTSNSTKIPESVFELTFTHNKNTKLHNKTKIYISNEITNSPDVPQSIIQLATYTDTHNDNSDKQIKAKNETIQSETQSDGEISKISTEDRNDVQEQANENVKLGDVDDNDKYGSSVNKSNNICDHENGHCEQVCENGTCGCFKGFRLIAGRHCYDTNECNVEGICDHTCVNVMGSYHCKCRTGYKLIDNGKCIDENECYRNNGKGPCEYACENTVGSFKCSCMSGTKRSKVVKCVDIDECTNGAAACSHECTNYYGGFYCSCPEGMDLLPDNKTCLDVNECELPEVSSQCVVCNNTIGSYKCFLTVDDLLLEKNVIKTCPTLDPTGGGYFDCTRSKATRPYPFREVNSPGTSCRFLCGDRKPRNDVDVYCGVNGDWMWLMEDALQC